jgi:hypothetical protein
MMMFERERNLEFLSIDTRFSSRITNQNCSESRVFVSQFRRIKKSWTMTVSKAGEFTEIEK